MANGHADDRCCASEGTNIGSMAPCVQFVVTHCSNISKVQLDSQSRSNGHVVQSGQKAFGSKGLWQLKKQWRVELASREARRPLTGESAESLCHPDSLLVP
jgi:hypothetical protein